MKFAGLHTDHLIGWSVSAGLHVVVAGAALNWGASDWMGVHQYSVPSGQARTLEARFAGSEATAESIPLAATPLHPVTLDEHRPQPLTITRADPINHPHLTVVEVGEFELTAEQLSDDRPELAQQPRHFAEQGEPRSDQPPAKLARHASAFRPGEDLVDQIQATIGAHTLPSPFSLNRPPLYPADAEREGRQGRVVLLILVSAEGLVARVSVAESSGSVSLDAAALEAAKQWRFTPAQLDGAPIEYELKKPIRFRIER